MENVTNNSPKVVKIDYETVATMYFVKGCKVQDIADKFGISWEDARNTLRKYGFTVAKSEKAPEVAVPYVIEYTNPEKLVAKKTAVKVEETTVA